MVFDPNNPEHLRQAEQQFNENMSLLNQKPGEPVSTEDMVQLHLADLKAAVRRLPESRARSLAITKLDEAGHWLNDAIMDAS